MIRRSQSYKDKKECDPGRNSTSARWVEHGACSEWEKAGRVGAQGVRGQAVGEMGARAGPCGAG